MGVLYSVRFVFVNRELGKERIQVQREGRSERERERDETMH